MKETYRYINENTENIKILLSELVSIRSVMGEPMDNAPFGIENAKCLDTALLYAKKLGFEVKNAGGYYGYADYIPKGAKEIKLGILCHLDVVPEGDGWSYEPFKVTEKDGILYGRGVTDDKGPFVSSLFALKAVKECCSDLKYGVRLIIGCNEENGSKDIEKYLSEETMPPYVFTPDAEYPVINCEKGMIRTTSKRDFPEGEIIRLWGGHVINAVPGIAYAELDNSLLCDTQKRIAENNTGFNFEITDKNDNSFTLICNGISAHASTPKQGLNSITGILELLALLPVNEKQRAVIDNILEIYGTDDCNGKKLNMYCCDDSGELTHVLSIINTENNTLSINTDTRYSYCETLDNISDKIRKSHINSGFTGFEYTGSSPHKTDKDSEFVKALLEVYKEYTGRDCECVAIGGGTYVHDINGGVAFGVEHHGVDYKIHGADEFVPVNELIENACIFADAIEKICR